MSETNFPSSPDEEPTPAEKEVHEPIQKTVASMRRVIHIMMVVSIISTCCSGFLVFWQTVVLSDWRAAQRAIVNETLERTRITSPYDLSVDADQR